MIKTHHIHIHAAMLAFKCQSNVLMIRRVDGETEGDGCLMDVLTFFEDLKKFEILMKFS